jgi:hypothetical protein
MNISDICRPSSNIRSRTETFINAPGPLLMGRFTIRLITYLETVDVIGLYLNVRYFRGAVRDTDYYLVTAKIREGL